MGSALREDDLVAALRAIVERRSRRIRLGIGDDAAAWQPSRSHRSVITSDALVESVHFSRDWMSWREVGVRAMAANISDIAAMGARPLLATVALGLPSDVELESVLEVYRGLVASADDAKAAIVGGDITRAPMFVLAITAIGEVRETRLKRREGARAGDVLACTGPLGASRAGLQLLRGEVTLNEGLRDQALAAFRTPQARWREGMWLAASRNVRAMMDCSDGLSTDLSRLCERSGVGAVVLGVPVAPAARAAAQALGQDAAEFALAGGEDFELLVAVAPTAFDHLAMRFEAHFRRPLIGFGFAEEEPGVRLRRDGAELAISPSGWDHLS
jgi:thiamine-monophosphate kinase